MAERLNATNHELGYAPTFTVAATADPARQTRDRRPISHLVRFLRRSLSSNACL